MLVIGLLMLAGFLAVAVSMIAAVAIDDRPPMPDMEALALPDGVAVIDSHASCDASECDGYGIVVDRSGAAAEDVIYLVESTLRSKGWWGGECPQGEVCLRRGELGVVLVPWVAVDDTVATAIRTELTAEGVDQGALVYVLYHRCGVLHPCP